MRSLNRFGKIIFVCMVTAAAMFFAVPAAQTAYADTQAPVKYVDENGTEHQVNSYTVLKNDMTEIGSAEGTWYVVNENVTFENNLKVKDNAKAYIILCDGKKMRCKDNFTVNETSELTIWGQKETSGELESSGGYFSAYAAIGGAPDHSNGLIEIHSGYVNAHLGGAIFFNRGAAIGAGNGADGGVIRILGGKVLAYTEGAGTGIRGGHKGASGKILISGGENGSLTMKDCTVTDNNAYAVWISGRGSLNIEGTIKLTGNVDGGIWLEKNCKINISGPLSKDSVIPISLRHDGDGKVEPTKDAPVVLTTGLKDNGTAECFTSDEDRYRIGVDANGEAVIGFPTSISFDKGDGSQARTQTHRGKSGDLHREWLDRILCLRPGRLSLPQILC